MRGTWLTSARRPPSPTLAELSAESEIAVRGELTRDRLRALMREIGKTAPPGVSYRVYLVGGGTAVLTGWRSQTIDADLFSEQEEVFRDIQAIKERLDVNVEFVRPEHFVPELAGSADRHVFIETIGPVAFYHYDPYAQILSKVVRGFHRDVEDAGHFIKSGMVEPERLRSLVAQIPDSAYSRYPSLSPAAVRKVVDDFLSHAL